MSVDFLQDGPADVLSVWKSSFWIWPNVWSMDCVRLYVFHQSLQVGTFSIKPRSLLSIDTERSMSEYITLILVWDSSRP